jgi:hypothetical protein
MTEAIRLICPACERHTSRLVGGLHCVSCYNRRREVAAGRDRRGRRPQLTDALHVERFAVMAVAGGVVVTEVPEVRSMAEAILRKAKHADGAILFGRPSATLLHAS